MENLPPKKGTEKEKEKIGKEEEKEGEGERMEGRRKKRGREEGSE